MTKQARWLVAVGFCLALIPALLLSCATGGVGAKGNKILTELVAHDTTRYEGAIEAILGAIGRKLPVSGNEAFFERVTIPTWESLEIYNAGGIEVSRNQILGLKGGISAATIGELKVKLVDDNSTQFRLVFVQIRDPLKLAEEMDGLLDEKSILDNIINERNLRIVTGVAVVFDQKTASEFEAGFGGTTKAIKVAGQELDVKVEANGSRTSQTKIADGTIIAYQISRLCWSPAGRLRTFSKDIKGRDACPQGSSDVLEGSRRPAVSSQGGG